MDFSRVETVEVPGGSFALHVRLPESGRGPGLVLVHEIFGVNDYMADSATALAALGYVVGVPDLYWRVQPGLSLPHDRTEEAIAAAQKLDPEACVSDIGAALARLRALPETGGRAGVLGFCLGGTLAYLAAAAHDPDVAVSYYGSGVPDALDRADAITCPTLFHFGGRDPYIPRDKVEAARDALQGRPGLEFHVHEDAGHAFDNHRAPQFHDPGAKARAWEITTDFLRRNFPA